MLDTRGLRDAVDPILDHPSRGARGENRGRWEEDARRR